METDFADEVVVRLEPDGELAFAAKELVVATVGDPEPGEDAVIDLVELVAIDRIVEEVGEVRE